MAKRSISDIPGLIRAKWSCLDYARNVLCLPVNRDGDRCTSITPGPHTHNNGFVIHEDWWYDYSGNIYGDVIELCAIVRHNGDKSAAFRELGAEFFTDGLTPSVYKRHQESLEHIIDRWHKALRPEDREYLHARRITDETIDRLKLGYCGDKRSWYYDRIIIPYWKNGKPVYYAGRDCSGLWKTDSKNHPKYKKMWTKRNEFSENYMWGLHTHVPDWCDTPEKHKYLLILEGQFDVMSFEQEHWHVLSPIGGHFAKKLMPLIKSICKNFEKVFICMDNDGPGVSFQRAMAEFLFSNQIPFVCGHVPSEFNGTPIKDVSDLYTVGYPIERLVEEATEGIIDLARSYHDGEEKEFHKFITTAGRFVDKAELTRLAKHCVLDPDYVKECLKEAKRPPLETTIAEEVTKRHDLRYLVNDSFYEYAHGVWNAEPVFTVQYYVRERLGRYATAAAMSAVTRHVMTLTHTTHEFNTQNIINFLDGVLELDTMELKPHANTYLSTIQIPRTYQPEAKCPGWEQFVWDVMDGKRDKITLCQQMWGSLFMKNNKLNKGFFLMGDGANGKSVMIETIRYVIDPRNCSNVELSDMADRFEPLRLRNKMVNFATETRVDLKGAETAIKKVISGETISAAHKGVDAVEFEPHCKIIAACNNFINSKDITHGFVRRLKFIVFPKIYDDRTADPELLDKLKAEAPGILNWMIEGWKMLKESGKYIETSEEVRTREEFLMLANPLAAFIRMSLEGICGKFTAVDLYKSLYIPWTNETNTGKMSLINFTRQLKVLMRQMMPKVKITVSNKGNLYDFGEGMITGDSEGWD